MATTSIANYKGSYGDGSNMYGRNGGASHREKLAQKWRAEASGTLTQILLYLDKHGSPTNSTRVKIYADGATPTTGSLLATSDLYSNASLSAEGASPPASMTTITFSGAEQIAISAGTDYYFVLETNTIDDTNYPNAWEDESSTTYSYGDVWAYDTSWHEFSPSRVFGFDIEGLTSATNTKSIAVVGASSQNLSITDAAQTGLDLTTALTFEAWVKFYSLPASGRVMGFWQKRGGSGNRSYGWGLYNDSGTRKLFTEVWNTVPQYDQVAIPWTPSLETWYHVAFTWEGSTKEQKLYVDGVQQGSTFTGTKVVSIYNSTAAFETGLYSDTIYFNGNMDELRVWNVVRTATEIADNYKKVIDVQAGLVGYWRMEDYLNDSSGNGNTLTNNNSATYSTDIPTWTVGPVNLKKIASVASASVKKISGVAIASVKKVAGVA